MMVKYVVNIYTMVKHDTYSYGNTIWPTMWNSEIQQQKNKLN